MGLCLCVCHIPVLYQNSCETELVFRNPFGSWVRISASPLPGNSLGQVAHMHVPLSPSSIVWYWLVGSDALWLER